MTKEEYLVNPCAKLSIPYWKYLLLKQPHNIDIFHERDYLQNDLYNHVEKYFRLIHYLEKPLKHHQSISDINIAQDMKDLILQINHSYSNERITVNKDDIERWINHPTYDQSLRIKVVVDGHMIASGIAEYDNNTKEGIIEWVQVLPEYQRQGYGRMIVDDWLGLFDTPQEYSAVTVSNETLYTYYLPAVLSTLDENNLNGRILDDIDSAIFNVERRIAFRIGSVNDEV